jgi:hypothetical protein
MQDTPIVRAPLFVLLLETDVLQPCLTFHYKGRHAHGSVSRIDSKVRRAPYVCVFFHLASSSMV